MDQRQYIPYMKNRPDLGRNHPPAIRYDPETDGKPNGCDGSCVPLGWPRGGIDQEDGVQVGCFACAKDNIKRISNIEMKNHPDWPHYKELHLDEGTSYAFMRDWYNHNITDLDQVAWDIAADNGPKNEDLSEIESAAKNLSNISVEIQVKMQLDNEMEPYPISVADKGEFPVKVELDSDIRRFEILVEELQELGYFLDELQRKNGSDNVVSPLLTVPRQWFKFVESEGDYNHLCRVSFNDDYLKQLENEQSLPEEKRSAHEQPQFTIAVDADFEERDDDGNVLKGDYTIPVMTSDANSILLVQTLRYDAENGHTLTVEAYEMEEGEWLHVPNEEVCETISGVKTLHEFAIMSS